MLCLRQLIAQIADRFADFAEGTKEFYIREIAISARKKSFRSIRKIPNFPFIADIVGGTTHLIHENTAWISTLIGHFLNNSQFLEKPSRVCAFIRRNKIIQIPNIQITRIGTKIATCA